MIHHHHEGRRRARRGAIRSSLLRLLAERPMHGYELIGELDERSGGRWRPSPGSVYPTLGRLEHEGLVAASEIDGRKRFELTDAGRHWLEEHPDDDESPWAGGPGRHGELRRLMAEIAGQLRQLARFGTPSQLERTREVLVRTRGELYQLLAEPEPADDERPAEG